MKWCWRSAAASTSSCRALPSARSPTASSIRFCGSVSRCTPRDDMERERLRERLTFYRDLKIDSLYLKPKAEAPMTPLPGLAPEHDTLLKIIDEIGDCKRCRLHSGRNKIVF